MEFIRIQNAKTREITHYFIGSKRVSGDQYWNEYNARNIFDTMSTTRTRSGNFRHSTSARY